MQKMNSGLERKINACWDQPQSIGRCRSHFRVTVPNNWFDSPTVTSSLGAKLAEHANALNPNSFVRIAQAVGQGSTRYSGSFGPPWPKQSDTCAEQSNPNTSLHLHHQSMPEI